MTSLLIIPSVQEVGNWSAIILHTPRVFIAPTPGVPFKILVPPMIRPAIIEYALCDQKACDLLETKAKQQKRAAKMVADCSARPFRSKGGVANQGATDQGATLQLPLDQSVISRRFGCKEVTGGPVTKE